MFNFLAFGLLKLSHLSVEGSQSKGWQHPRATSSDTHCSPATPPPARRDAPSAGRPAEQTARSRASGCCGSRRAVRPHASGLALSVPWLQLRSSQCEGGLSSSGHSSSSSDMRRAPLPQIAKTMPPLCGRCSATSVRPGAHRRPAPRAPWLARRQRRWASMAPSWQASPASRTVVSERRSRPWIVSASTMSRCFGRKFGGDAKAVADVP